MAGESHCSHPEVEVSRPPPANGFDIQARDLGEEHIAAMLHLFRPQSHVPAPLLLIQPTEKQIHLVVELPVLKWSVE